MESSSSSHNEIVQIDFPEKPKKEYFDIKNFSSKIGGLPVWFLLLFNNIDELFFTCSCGENLSF